MEAGTVLTQPRRCSECGNPMVWGKLHTMVDARRPGRIFPSIREGEHYVTRADMPPSMGFPVVVAVCTVCGHVSLYAAGAVQQPGT